MHSADSAQVCCTVEAVKFSKPYKTLGGGFFFKKKMSLLILLWVTTQGGKIILKGTLKILLWVMEVGQLGRMGHCLINLNLPSNHPHLPTLLHTSTK